MKVMGRGKWSTALMALMSVWALGGASPAKASGNPIDWEQIPLPACPEGRGGGDGHSPDPLSAFNQHVELAEGELYLIRGRVVLFKHLGDEAHAHKLQPYFNIDLKEHPWLGGVKRSSNPYYVIEGTASYWRAFEGSYGELAAFAHVQFRANENGDTVQVISLKPIPELSLIPKHD